MKLLSATSFFLFILFFLLLSSCTLGEKSKQKKSKRVFELENKAYQKYQDREYDSAIFYARKMLNVALEENSVISIKAAYNRLFLDFKNNKQYDSAIYYSEKLYELAEKTIDTTNMAKAKSRKGFYYKAVDSFSLAYKNFTESKNLYSKINDSLQVANKLLEISTLEKKIGNLTASQLSAIEGLEYVENTNAIRIKSKLYYNIAVSAKEQGDFIMAKKRINQALALAKDSKAIKEIGFDAVINYNNTKANIFKEQGSHQKAIEIYERLLNDSLGKLSKREEARINGNLGHALFLKNEYNKRSDSLLNYSLIINKEEAYTSGLISTYMKLAELYRKKNKQKAINYANNAIEYAKNLGNKNSIYEALQNKMLLEPNEKNNAAYVAIEQELEKEEDKMQSQFANAKFDFEKEENQRIKAENKVITFENKAIKAENEVTQYRYQVLGLALILIVLIVVVFIIYQKIKRRHKIEKVKTVHVTEARISSKVHDELANDLYKLISQLETTDPEKETILDKLDVIYNQARDISKQIQGVETGEGFAEELSNLFRSYQSEEVNVLLKRYNIDIWNGISSHIKVTVYRVLQELLTNMKKHSNAVLVVVSIEKNNKQLFIQYIDNGKGFAEEISKNGLQNAENRIHAIEGTLTFDTELHKGCKFSINVPV
jgi:tetratricopeptide (TPR) repeat protein